MSKPARVRVGRIATLHRRVLPPLAAVVLTAGLAATPAAASHPELPQPFSAQVRSACTFGWTTGEITWRAWHPPERPAVDVRGEVGDRAIPDCTELPPITFAEFRAFTGSTLVDREVRQVGVENPTRFQFTLRAVADMPAPPEIDRVVIRVCRGFPPDVPAVCGDEQTHRPPASPGQ